MQGKGIFKSVILSSVPDSLPPSELKKCLVRRTKSI